MRPRWMRLIELGAALGLAMLSIFVVHKMFEFENSQPERLVAGLEVLVVLLICMPHVLHHVVRVFHLLINRRERGHNEEPGFRFVLSLLTGLLGSVAIYGTFIYVFPPATPKVALFTDSWEVLRVPMAITTASHLLGKPPF
jgi:hypothetical protein